MDLNKPFYPYQLSEDSLRFDFQSINNEKSIHKVVQYSPIPDNESIYQLSFGDLQDDGQLDFLSVSDNSDMNMVLTTVIQTMFRFFELNPEKGVVFIGSNETRTRLYRIIINKLLDKMELYFNIIGIKDDGEQQIFVRNESYLAFLIFLKDEN
jgi:hypothetical protein